MSQQFRTQPILQALTLNVVALEVLATQPLAFRDSTEMQIVDSAALRYASRLVSETGLRVHFNMEFSTLLHCPDLPSSVVPGVVVELVERHDFSRASLPDIATRVGALRQAGAKIAMDDVTLTSTLESELVALLAPDWIKAEFNDLLAVTYALPTGIPVIAERIESEHQAILARELGADELQGFWCDREAANSLKAYQLGQAFLRLGEVQC